MWNPAIVEPERQIKLVVVCYWTYIQLAVQLCSKKKVAQGEMA
jgi:hypothetical protein